MDDLYPTTGSDRLCSSEPFAMVDRIGRYRVERVLGRGGFGVVYLAHDEQLGRPVAIKVPRRELIGSSADAAAYLAEARTAAGLDHPNIIPVFDVGASDEFPTFIVSKFIEGDTLARRVHEDRLPLRAMIELLATIADALHYAHGKGVVHRDIKPGNILLDAEGKPYVGDFGLALTDKQLGRGARYIGTPAYMSPEQARGEGHRVDGRSDIFSLGIVMYELLVGRHPFTGESADALREQIVFAEPPPLQQFGDELPKELDRICQKALAKRTSERYTTARDLADDLRAFLAEQPAEPSKPLAPLPVATPLIDTPHAPSTQFSVGLPVRIVPQGLRSFDAHDADFFLELLPGPRDRTGLPDSLRFWKTRIDQTDADQTFAVGLIYGPSGCGKSSLVKAGLLPRLGPHVIAVYLEATADDTEKRLLNGLRKRCPTLPKDWSLKATLAALRRGHGLQTGQKILVVLDQFEQWLHGGVHRAELVEALRQCDGGRLQAIVMVRDDFWMAATRFMRELDIRLLEGQNSAAVDLFDVDHARKVLAAFGRAYGKLPEKASETTKEQKSFLAQSVEGLAQDGKIICVRLALFAEMMKGRTWTAATLEDVGGTEGIGVTFLEETFSATTAPPEHRRHQKAIRAVLVALLPEAGADIKGHMRPQAALRDASGYAASPRDFDDLVRILDTELRLITPTDPEGQDQTNAPTDGKYYQLTHDYLVPSLRDWLTRKQKETRRGRAELSLADRAAVWSIRRESRQLPSLWQWLSIRALTRRAEWTTSQQQMMRHANRYHALRGTVFALVTAFLVWLGWETFGNLKAQALCERLLDANIAEVPAIVRDMTPYHRWLAPRLREQLAQAAGDPRKQLHVHLALLPLDPSCKENLIARLYDASPQETLVIREALSPHQAELIPTLWSVAIEPPKGREARRLRAAAALAQYDAASDRWSKIAEPLAADLVNVPSVFLGTWLEALRPAHASLLTPLSAIHRDAKRRETERSLATDILADYAADRPLVLADIVMDSDEQQFAVLLPKLLKFPDQAATTMIDAIETPLESKTNDRDKESLSVRQANAGVVLLRMNKADLVWPLLRASPDPRTRTRLIHRLSPLGVDPDILLKQLDVESDASIRAALLQSLGGYDEVRLSTARRTAALAGISPLRDHADPSLHASADWLMRQWSAPRTPLVRKESASKSPNWYVNGQGQTMVVIPRPRSPVWMGSPESEAGREAGKMEARHKKRIDRSFAIAAREVTVAEFQKFREKHPFNPQYAPTLDSPVNQVTWYQAAAYCNWLSEKEGLPKEEWCYVPNAAGEYAEGMIFPANCLERRGYRLPTEAEWEYACRGGTETARFLGEAGEFLDQYAWYTKNTNDRSMMPVGLLKPNDFGLFDMLGNALEWCHDRSVDYPAAGMTADDFDSVTTVSDKDYRALRGGAFYYPLMGTRAANRSRNVPTVKTNYIGFRPARTAGPTS